MDPSIMIIFPSYDSTSNITNLKADEFIISKELNEKFKKIHLPPKYLLTGECIDTFVRICCFIGYTLDDSIFLFRQLFYSTFEMMPHGSDVINDVNKALDYINRSPLNSMPVIMDYGGAFETQHLHTIQLAFPHAEIYSMDALYKDIDLLVCNINRDETKWCIIPVDSCTNENEHFEFIECLHRELENTSSFSSGISIEELKFSFKFDHLPIYDPYTEIFGFKKIHFIDSIEKCTMYPFCILMAYCVSLSTSTIEVLQSKGLVDPIYTKILTDYSHRESEVHDRHISDMKWANIHAELTQYRSLLTERPKVPEVLPRQNKLNWLDTHMLSKQLYDGLLINSITHNNNGPMTNSVIATSEFLLNTDCVYLNSRMKENFNLTIIRQFIEEHIGGFWKDDYYYDFDTMRKYPKNFVQECLHELLGSVINLHIYIDSYLAHYYSFEFIRQLKNENSNINIEISLDEQMYNKSVQTIVVLCFECNQNYVLSFMKFDSFLKYISTCTSIEEIKIKIESSIAFSYSLSHGQCVQWHQNQSFVYGVAYQDSLFEQIKDQLWTIGLHDMNFVFKKLELTKYFQPSKCQTNQAIIRFNFDRDPSLHYEKISLSDDLLYQLIFDNKKYRFTGPIVTLYPNQSRSLAYRYPEPIRKTNVGDFYNLICDDIYILIQWRNLLRPEMHDL